MKGKKFKISTGALIAIIIIIAKREYDEYKVKQEEKQGIMIENTIDFSDYENNFVPVEDNLDTNSNKKGGK